MKPSRRPVAKLSPEEHRQKYLEYRLAYLPRQLRATRRKLEMLCNEARRYGMTELLEEGE